jgi:AraC-like DNA-binding protein
MQIGNPDMRVGVAAQIAFLDLAARALDDPLLGFRLAHDLEPRQVGLLHYVLGSSATLGDAIERVRRYTSIVNAGVVVTCAATADFTVGLQYAGVARHSDRQQMEFLVTTFVRACRALTGQMLAPTSVSLVHRRSGNPAELERFLRCRITFGADADTMVFDRNAPQLALVGADPHLNRILLRYCEEALSHRGSNVSPVRVAVENAVAPLLPHGKARIADVARELGMSSRTLARRLSAEEQSFAGIVEQLRRDLVMRYLGEAGLSTSQVAWLVGYQGVSALTNACKRWTGKNPTQLRNRTSAWSVSAPSRGLDVT